MWLLRMLAQASAGWPDDGERVARMLPTTLVVLTWLCVGSALDAGAPWGPNTGCAFVFGVWVWYRQCTSAHTCIISMSKLRRE